MSREVLLLVDALAREKNVDKEIVFGALESALASATKKRYVDEETDILHWCDSKLPFAMCEFNLTARYVLEPEPRKPVDVTEESFDAAWHKAATEQQNTDRPFRECLKEALGIVDTRT